jgi:nucleoside transporter
MFLEYFIWGAWYVTMGTYLFTNFDASGLQVGSSYGNLSIAAIISPFFVGLIADRYFSAQKVMGVLHLTGAFTLYYLSTVHEFNEFWWLILIYTLLYMPTIALSNSVTFHHISNSGKIFPRIRVFGTIGWIVAGLLIGTMEWENSVLTFRIAALASLMLGGFCFLLPNVPPKKDRSTSIASIIGLDALVLFKSRSFVIFFITSIAICIPLSFYYSLTNSFLNDIGMSNAAGKMTLGQVSEVLFMLLIPLMFVRLGVKKMLLAGILAWILRYIFFAYGNVSSELWMLYVGIALHGICYDFFFVTGQIYTDEKAGRTIKSAAQGLVTLATYGIGMLIGSYLSGIVTDYYANSTPVGLSCDWKMIWLVPCFITVVVFILFAIFFKDKLHNSQIQK